MIFISSPFIQQFIVWQLLHRVRYEMNSGSVHMESFRADWGSSLSWEQHDELFMPHRIIGYMENCFFFYAGPYKGNEFPKMACVCGHNFINTALINNTWETEYHAMFYPLMER
jgi:hypothetical protein